jgi:hypothetical protein
MVSDQALVELISCKYERKGCTCQAGCRDKGWVAQYRFLTLSTDGHGQGAEKLLQWGEEQENKTLKTNGANRKNHAGRKKAKERHTPDDNKN